ncbi:MAG: molybdopterin-dependent oxidoreductase [Proteobacteria bacterium]|nr:molybdopterin-dependent oxidoreductase [Pseudomonadota bacterium]
MKLDRRNFIKFAVGAVAGIHLTPLPWKLIDDSAIWTQNWPWVPKLTRFPEITYAHTVCNLCPGGCGIKVRTVDASASVKVEGLESAPVNQGGVCPVGAAGPQYQYSLSRFQSPLKRIGSRGSGAYAKVSWDEALKAVGGRLAELRGQGQAHTVVMVSGRRNSLAKNLAQRFMTAYGSPNLTEMPSQAASAEIAEMAQFGRPGAVGYDLENAALVLSFGCQIIEGWGSPVRSIQAYSGWRASGKTRLVQIEPRASLTASKADRWVAIAPGAEAALALGMANVIIRKNLYDQRFVGAMTEGFEAFKDMVLKEYGPRDAARMTGVPGEVIEELALAFAKSKAPLALAGKGKGGVPTSVYEMMAVQSLNALVGNINKPGGVILRKDLPLAPWPDLELDDQAKTQLAFTRLDLAGTDRHPVSGGLVRNLVQSINEGRYYPVNVLIIDQANPAFLGVDPGEFRAALDKIPLVVTLSGQADDTSIQADLVLPETSNFDGPVDVINPPTLPYPLFGSAGPVFDKPSVDARPIGDIYIGLAKAVGGPVQAAMPFKNHKEMIARTAAGLFASGRGLVAGPEGPASGFGASAKGRTFGDEGAFLKALSRGVFWYDPAFEFGGYEGAFQTPSSRFEFVSQTLKDAYSTWLKKKGRGAASALGVEGGPEMIFMPHYEPGVPEADEKAFPLLLVPVEQFKLVTSPAGNAPYLTKLLEDLTLKENDLVVEINPQTAAARHLKNGERAWLATRKGRLMVRVYLYDGARPDTVFAPIGLGHIGYGHYLRGKGVNPMEIVEGWTDPLSGQALWWATRANLTKV